MIDLPGTCPCGRAPYGGRLIEVNRGAGHPYRIEYSHAEGVCIWKRKGASGPWRHSFLSIGEAA